MRGRNWPACVALVVMLAACVPAVAQRQAVAVAAAETMWAPKKVTLDLKGVPLDEAIRQVVAATDLSVLITGEIPKEPRVTMRLAQSDPMGVLQLLAQASGLRYAESQRDRVSEPAVVLLAARETFGGDTSRGPQSTRTPEEAPKPARNWIMIMPAATQATIDLDLNNTPFREAVAEIAKQIPTSDQARIVVDDLVPQDTRVTARVRKMNLTWVLDSIVEQAGLTYGVQHQTASDVGRGPGERTIYIVPKPEIRVSGGGK